MYQFTYEEVLEDTPRQSRYRERQAFDHSIELLEAAEQAGPNTPEAVTAIAFMRRLWIVLIDDLAKSENELPQQLRADLISIGLFLLKEAEQISQGKSQNFRGLIEISQTIAMGLHDETL